MTKHVAAFGCALLALAVLAGAAPTQKKADIVGTWTGFANSPDMRFDLTVVFAKGETGYTGKMSDASGTLVDVPLRDIVLKDGKVTFEFDLTMGVESMLIRIELSLENETLKGFWFNVEGNSDVVELALKK
jgi:hypothetical protein